MYVPPHAHANSGCTCEPHSDPQTTERNSKNQGGTTLSLTLWSNVKYGQKQQTASARGKVGGRRAAEPVTRRRRQAASHQDEDKPEEETSRGAERAGQSRNRCSAGGAGPGRLDWRQECMYDARAERGGEEGPRLRDAGRWIWRTTSRKGRTDRWQLTVPGLFVACASRVVRLRMTPDQKPAHSRQEKDGRFGEARPQRQQQAVTSKAAAGLRRPNCATGGREA